MNRSTLGSLFIALLFNISASALAAGADFEFILAWVNKYPSDRATSNTGGLLDQNAIKNILNNILPRKETIALSKFTVETPVSKVGDFIVVNKCLPHNCPSDMAMVVINVRSKNMWVGFFSRADKYVSTRWYGTSEDYSGLPEEIRKDFLTRHGD